MEMSEDKPVGRLSVDAYGDGGFRVAGQRIEGSLLMLPNGPESWQVGQIADLQLSDFAAVLEQRQDIEILLVGTGGTIAFLSKDIRTDLNGAGIKVDAMDTGAAARTYNVLIAEGRRVAAALIAA